LHAERDNVETAAEGEVWEAFSALFSSAQLSQDWGCPENPQDPKRAAKMTTPSRTLGALPC